MPFGHLIMMLFWGVVFSGGVLLFLLGRWLRKRSLQLIGGSIVTLVVALVVRDVVVDSQTDWNPLFAPDSEIAGTWSDSREKMILHPDHTFTYHSGKDRFSGTWSRQDWNLYLHLKSRAEHREMRVIRYFGKLRLMTHPPEDPDSWDGNVGLKLQK